MTAIAANSIKSMSVRIPCRDVVLDGERVVKLKPVFGYLHRNHEKIAENDDYFGSDSYLRFIAPVDGVVESVRALCHLGAPQRSRLADGIHSVSPLACLRVVQPSRVSSRWCGPQARVRLSMPVVRQAAYSLTWWTSHR